MSGIVNDTARLIRRVDGDNRMSPYDLSMAVADFLYRRSVIDADCLTPVSDFICRTNPDKRMGSGHLAELIVAEFNLDKEN